jgi:hypothetical protein
MSGERLNDYDHGHNGNDVEHHRGTPSRATKAASCPFLHPVSQGQPFSESLWDWHGGASAADEGGNQPPAALDLDRGCGGLAARARRERRGRPIPSLSNPHTTSTCERPKRVKKVWRSVTDRCDRYVDQRSSGLRVVDRDGT